MATVVTVKKVGDYNNPGVLIINGDPVFSNNAELIYYPGAVTGGTPLKVGDVITSFTRAKPEHGVPERAQSLTK